MMESTDKYAGYAEQELEERGIKDPSTELLRLELIVQHLREAESLAAMLGLLDLEHTIQKSSIKARDIRGEVEHGSRITPS